MHLYNMYIYIYQIYNTDIIYIYISISQWIYCFVVFVLGCSLLRTMDEHGTWAMASIVSYENCFFLWFVLYRVTAR